MSTWRAFCETVHLVVLGLWLGVLIAVGATAAIVFPTMKSLGVRVPEITGDAADHYRIAGGMVAERVFLLGDAVMFPCGLIAAATLGCSFMFFRSRSGKGAAMLRAVALGIALASLAALLLVVTPAINSASAKHRAAAKIGDVPAAQAAMKAVDELHPTATNLMAAEAAAVLITLVAGAWSLARGREIGGPDEIPAAASRYEDPALLKGRRA
jgi:hypothetical protein